MNTVKGFGLGAISAAVLIMAPMAPAAAGPHGGYGRGGLHHCGLGAAVVGLIVGVATLPFAIADAVIQSAQPDVPPAPYYPAPPAAYYPAPYYAPRAYGPQVGYGASGYYAARPGYGRGYTGAYGSYAAPRSSYYSYRR